MIKRKRSDPDANINAAPQTPAPDTTQAPVLNQQLQNLSIQTLFSEIAAE